MSWRRSAMLMWLVLVMARSAEPQAGDAIARALAEDFFAGRFAPMAARFRSLR